MPTQNDTLLIPSRTWLALIVGIFAATCLPGFVGSEEVKPAKASQWSTLITPEQLRDRSDNEKLLVIDARSLAEYTAGHIPGAISLPGSEWRTPPSKDVAKDGPGQRIFRRTDGSLDVDRYEALLGSAGITADREIVVYGNHAGKADGSVPATILLKLGHDKVAFLDGVGLERWKVAGLPVSEVAVSLPAARYVAAPTAGSLWSAEELLKNLNNDDVVIVDSRTAAEFSGEELRGNKRGGHIPGALLLSSEEFLNKESGTTISVEAAKAKIEKLIPKGKKVVVYCQSGTRCSHEELILKDLGYENVILHDASWQEWGNRSDTPVEKSTIPASTASAVDK
jgi:thiosulfate/3-mercaptopyruvate sulfurtransferase